MKKIMINKFISFGRPQIGPQEIKAVVKVLKSGWIGSGPKVIEFEQEFKRYIGSRSALAFNSCTAALHLSLLLAGVKKGDEVITSPFTYATTGNVILHQGAKPVFVDVDLKTYNLDPGRIAQKINSKTKAIIPVHFGGLPCEMNGINALARKHHLKVIEDAAHAVGARYGGKMIGDSSNFVCFSFYPNKNITSIEGGMLTTNNQGIEKRLRWLRSNGVSQEAWGRYKAKKGLPGLLVEPGYKYNMTDVQAALGLIQLKKIERWQKVREKYARIFDYFFAKIPGLFRQYRPSDSQKNRHALHLYTLRIDPKRFKIGRNKIVQELNKKNIGAAVHYIPLHLHPFYKKTLGYKRGDFPKAELISDNIFTIPSTPDLKERDIKAIGLITHNILIKNGK